MAERLRRIEAKAEASRAPLAVDFGREICGSLEAAEQREWLVTNGIGGYASGTIAGSLTRRYHGLLIAALRPPLGRTLLVAKIDEIARYNGRAYPLATNRWLSGALDPQGYQHIQRFRLEGATPVWTFAYADALLEKSVWMQPGANTTYVRYELVRGDASGAVELELKVLVNYRDFHGGTRAGPLANEWRMQIAPVEHGLCVEAFENAVPLYLLSCTPVPAHSPVTVEPTHEWYRDYELALERHRGLDSHEDHLHAGAFRTRLAPGESVTLVFSTDPAPNLDSRAAWASRQEQERSLLNCWAGAHGRLSSDAPAWVRQLALAADQFIVARPSADGPEARSIIAGYHWFGDWGRDTMVALPGLALATGRPEIARSILRCLTRFVDCGMVPNFFPEGEGTPEYNSVDATLWYFEACRQYFAGRRDADLLRELFPSLTEIVDWHVRGTRHNIRMDPADGLLAAGEPGIALTWMDARVAGRPVTPRIGKPVEVNALWYNALLALAQFARALRKPAGACEKMAHRVRRSFQRFWNEPGGYCFDVIDGPNGNDPALRPNQILAVSLPESPLTRQQQRAVVDTCARRLLTPYGLRSLAPGHPEYRGQYSGPPAARDSAYHQGTTWGWLLGSFVLAHLRVYSDRAQAKSYLEPMESQLQLYGLGTLGEIFDGEPPFPPRGCIAQAWSVAEPLRAYVEDVMQVRPKFEREFLHAKSLMLF